jgi:alkanesulfonate monooxygenase SsuD/methylene tetrahydromethanopterin reductase-like flavin-dependent oxidoreductase (luciferase family)
MTDRLVDSIAIFGTLDECKERIAAYVAAGVDTTAISVLSFDPTVFARVIEGFAPGR